jgi:hypothetical protein
MKWQLVYVLLDPHVCSARAPRTANSDMVHCHARPDPTVHLSTNIAGELGKWPLTKNMMSKGIYFYFFALLGTCSIWGGSFINGSLAHLFRALHGAHEYVLPGTDAGLRESYTGVYWPFDYLLRILVIFFWEAVDGSHPTTSIIGIYFLGQYLSFLAVLYLDSLRVGNRKALGFIRLRT